MHTFSRRALAVMAISAALVGGLVVAASAANPNPLGVITACVKGTGEYFPKTNCKEGYRAIRWNAKGVQGARGPKGAKGNAGAPGPQGIQGPAGADGVSGYEQVFSPVFPLPAGGDSILSGAICPQGKKPVGGGFSMTGADPFNGEGIEVGSNGAGTINGEPAWIVSLHNSSAQNREFVVQAICVSAL